MASSRDNITSNCSDGEAIRKMMDSLNNCVETQAQMMTEILAAVKDLSERVAKCEMSQEETFRTRLDNLASMPTPERHNLQEATAANEVHPVIRPQEDEASLIDFGADTNDAIGMAGVGLSALTQPPRANNVRPEPIHGSHFPPASTSFSRPPLRRPIPHSTPLRTPAVRFRETFSLDDPVPESLTQVPVLMPTRIKVSPQEYCGKQPWKLYKRHYEAVAKISGWSEEMKALYLVPFLRGTALSFYDTLSEAVRADYARLDAAFDARFSNRFAKTVAHIKLRGCVQAPRESLTEFATRVQEYAALAFEDDPVTTREAVSLAQFIDGIADVEIQQRVRDTWPETLEEALALAERIEASREATRICRRQVRVAVTNVHSSPPRRTTAAASKPQSGSGNSRRYRTAVPGPQTITERGITGRIRVFLEGRKYGFITREDNGENVFLHRNEIINIPRNSSISPKEGDQVQFDILWTNRTPAARNVTLITPPSTPYSPHNNTLVNPVNLATYVPPVSSANVPSPSATSDAILTTSNMDLNNAPLTFRG